MEVKAAAPADKIVAALARHNKRQKGDTLLNPESKATPRLYFTEHQAQAQKQPLS